LASGQAVDGLFPTLARAGYTITSPSDDSYNCVAWVARDLRRWWEPALDGGYWPRRVSEDELDAGDLPEYVRLFESLGFRRCADGSVVHGQEKIAIYACVGSFEHVAYQRSDGSWSSKLGKLNDIRHGETDSLSGPGTRGYPPVALYMSRRREPHDLAESESGLLLR
jgi:hypothetical protein